MSEPLVLTRQQEHLYFVTLNRPEKRNALTQDMLEQLARAVRACDTLPDLRAILINANGPVFSAGVDVMALAGLRASTGGQHPSRWLRRLADRWQRLLYDIESIEIPVIAVLQGRVIGLGLELALACDLRVAAVDAELSLPETRLGLVADVGGTTRLSRTVGPSRAKDLLMTARAIGAAEALQWGLVNRVVPVAALQEAALILAQEIARNAPLAVGMTKHIIDQGDGLDKHTQMALERWAQSQLITSEDAAEAMSAFLEKRPGRFVGK